jgi:hypothetical protein
MQVILLAVTTVGVCGIFAVESQRKTFELHQLGFLSRICGVILVPGVVPSCDRGQFP